MRLPSTFLSGLYQRYFTGSRELKNGAGFFMAMLSCVWGMISQVAIDQRFQVFLPARARPRLDAFLLDVAGERLERRAPGEDAAPEMAVPGGVALVDVMAERVVLDHLRGHEQGAGAQVD